MGWDGEGEEGAEPLVRLCQDVCDQCSLRVSGQQHPVIPWNLGEDGVSPQPWPYELQRAGECGGGAGGDQLSQDWEGPLPHISLFEQLSEPELGLIYIQAAG